MILVDVGTPRMQLRGSPQLQAEEFKVPWFKVIAGDLLVNMGLTRWAGACSKIEPTHNYGAGVVQAEMDCFPPIGTDLKELQSVAADGEETYQTGPYTFPILIFSQSWSDPKIMPKFSTPALDEEAIQLWNQMQKELKNLSPNSRQIIVRNTGHLGMVHRPDGLLKEIPAFIEQIRQHAPVSGMNGTTTTE